MWSDSDDGSRELRTRDPPPAPSPGLAGGRHQLREHSGPAAAALAAAATAGAPNIAQLNVSKNSRMHVGPKFISVTQNVHNTEMVQGRVLGLELQAGAGEAAGVGGARRLRCSVAVFVCWALVVACALAFYVCKLALAQRPARIDLGLTESWYVRRADWQAMPSYGVTFLELPARFALVGHSVTPWCVDRYKCTERVLAIQHEHQRFGWNDIGPNFLVSGNGLVFEGRGANVLGAMVRKWNARSVSLMFLGDYRAGHDTPVLVQLEHAARLLEELVHVGALHPEYTLLAHCQAVPQRVSPGRLLVDALKAFDHWNGTDTTGCLPG